MRAVIRRGNQLVVDEVPELDPQIGQTLVRTLACGICGSDIHCLHEMDQVAEAGRRSGAGDWIDSTRDIIFGHEFCAEILAHGPRTSSHLKPGTRVVSMPFLPLNGKMEWVGISNHTPGGFAEQMLLSQALLLPVPNGLSSDRAALTEPLAVGLHAVATAGLAKMTPALVVGCGPVGLAVIAALKLSGHGPIIASDFSAERRKAAEALGADFIVDPAEQSPHQYWKSIGVAPTIEDKLLWSITGKSSLPSVVFECVGAPGIIGSLIEAMPPGSQIIVAGVCNQPDTFEPSIAIHKHITLRFVISYTPEEFALSLNHLAEGQVDVTQWITGSVGLDSVSAAFERLREPGADVKIIVKPV